MNVLDRHIREHHRSCSLAAEVQNDHISNVGNTVGNTNPAPMERFDHKK
jgi:hypothetical protein